MTESINPKPRERDVKAKAILRRFRALRERRTNWDDHWRDVANYCIPRKDNIYDFKTQSKGEKKNLRVYDSSAIDYVEKLASALHSMLTNPSVQWFELTTGNPELDKNARVRSYLQELVRRIHQLLNNSNFQSQIHELYLDLASFGTGAMLIESDDDLIFNFTSRPIYQFHIEENFQSEVDVFFYEEEMTLRQAFQKYGEEKFDDDDKRNYLKDKDTEITIVRAIMPNKERNLESKLAKDKKYASFHMYEDKEVMLEESGFDEFPAVFPRWVKGSEEVYGRSPAMKALPDIKMINVMQKVTIRAAQKAVDPPLMVPDDGALNVNTRPGGLNSYRAGTDDRIFPLETGSNPGIGIEMMQDVRQRIEKAFFIDQLQLRDGPQMTATEVNARIDQQLRLLGPMLGRLHFELLQPLIARIIGVMKEKRQLPTNVPEELEGVTPEVFFTSQIAKAQRIAETQNYNRFINSIAPLAASHPQIMDNLDPDGVFRFNAQVFGIPEEMINSKDQVRKDRKDRADQEAAARQAELQAQQAQTAATTAQADGGGLT